MKRDKIDVNDRQLACAHISSQEGQDYMKGMAAAANFAWVNRSCMTFCARQVSRFSKSRKALMKRRQIGYGVIDRVLVCF